MTEHRREDDKIGENGEPVSPAHKAIYGHIDECKLEVINHQNRVIEEFEARHITERHHEPMSTYLSRVNLTPQDLVESAVLMHDVLPGLEDFVYGPARKDPATGRVLVDGNGRPLRDETKGAQHAVNNGGFKAHVPRWMVSIIVALIMASASIGVAVIQHSADTQNLIDQVVLEIQQLEEDVGG